VEPEAWRGIGLDRERRTVWLPAGVSIDLGGLAKGWAADLIARRSTHPVLVDAGGDLAVSGPLPDGGPWPIAIGDPFEPRANLATVALLAGGVATSGRDYRVWRQGGELRHHLIDPRTGRPAVTDVLTVSVVAPSALLAEIAAKVVFLLGVDEGMRWIDARPALAALAVRDDRRAIASGRFADYLWTDCDDMA
jgi:thiamine biosynthesis lipoprotein